MQIKVDETGYNGNPVNPFQKILDQGFMDGDIWYQDDPAWHKFDKSHPSLPLTERQEPGAVVECKPVWRERYGEGWRIRFADPSVEDLIYYDMLKPVVKTAFIRGVKLGLYIGGVIAMLLIYIFQHFVL